MIAPRPAIFRMARVRLPSFSASWQHGSRHVVLLRSSGRRMPRGRRLPVGRGRRRVQNSAIRRLAPPSRHPVRRVTPPRVLRTPPAPPSARRRLQAPRHSYRSRRRPPALSPARRGAAVQTSHAWRLDRNSGGSQTEHQLAFCPIASRFLRAAPSRISPNEEIADRNARGSHVVRFAGDEATREAGLFAAWWLPRHFALTFSTSAGSAPHAGRPRR